MPERETGSDSAAINVLIVEDHPLFREGLRRGVEKISGFVVVGEAGDAEEGLALADKLKPGIVILDLNLPRISGLEVARKLQSVRFPVRVIVVTMNDDEATFNKALNYGVKGYVLKENAVAEIASCVRAVGAGGSYLTPSMSDFLLRRRQKADVLLASTPGLARLTTAERRILRLIADKKASKQIARELFVSVRTVDTHRANISDKLDLHGTHALLQFAIEHRAEL